MLTSQVKEATQDVIKIEEIDGRTLQILIEFCYTGKILINNGNIAAILAGASKIELIQVEKLCAKYLTNELCVENCLSTWFLAEQYSLISVKMIALKMMQFEFVFVINADEFLHLHTDELKIVLANNAICVYSEETIFTALISWIEFDEQSRSPLFPYLVNLIRIEYIQMKVR